MAARFVVEVARLLRRARAAIGFGHALGHACVCVFVLAAWAVPPLGGADDDSTKTHAPTAVAAPTEAETDEQLRRAAVSALGTREGAVVVLDARTGRLRAVVNSRLAFEQATAPGSTVKPFAELTALETSVLNEETRAACHGGYEGGHLKLNCAHPRHQPAFDPVRALAHSCNNFFGEVGERLDAEAYRRRLEAFGFGATTGASDREAAGSLPRAAKGSHAGAAATLGEGGTLQVTPVQLVAAYAALFNGGRLLAPRRALGPEFTTRERARVELDEHHRALLLRGLRGAVSYGTAARAGLGTLPVQVFGKTGTSTPSDDFRPQGWFVGFTSDREPDNTTPAPDSISLAVLVLLKRAHGSDAAAVSRPIFETHARLLRQKTVEQEARPTGETTFEATAPSSSSSSSTLTVRLAREDVTLRLSLDDYVFGVLAAEGSVEDELEALKAQAVVSRTYALKNLRRHARDRYDLCTSTHCQRYIQVTDESRRPDFYALVRRAVAETSGEVLRDREGRLAESYFSASCGGATADISALWGVRSAPAHLRGVGDEFCALMPHRSWTDVIPREQLLRALRSDPRSDVGARLDAVRVLKRDRTGRAESVVVEGERARRLSGWDFKIIVGRELGWKTLKSSRFEVTRAGDNFIFRGSGFGHGLGLCQSGAHVLARRGATYRQILANYLPGATVGTQPASQLSTLNSQLLGFGVRVSETARWLLREALSIVSPPVVAQAGRRSLSSEHFRVSFPARAARGEVEGALDVLEAARADVVRRLDAASVSAAPLGFTAELFVHETTGEFVGATGEAVWVAAVTRGRRVESQPLETLRRRRVLSTTLRHEFVHVAAEALSRGRAPRWLVEGLAVHVAGEGRLVVGNAPRRKLTVEEIERGLERPGSQREQRELYAAAYAEVLAIVRREGESAVWRRLARG